MAERLSRGHIISLLAGIPAAVAVTAAGASAADTAAATSMKKSLAYVDKSKVAGKTCANCRFYTAGSPAGSGTCAIIPGGTVKAAGWCKSYAAK